MCYFTSTDPFWKILYINIIQLWDILPITYCCDHPCIITQVLKYIHIYIYIYIYVYSISRSISITTSRFTCACIDLYLHLRINTDQHVDPYLHLCLYLYEYRTQTWKWHFNGMGRESIMFISIFGLMVFKRRKDMFLIFT